MVSYRREIIMEDFIVQSGKRVILWDEDTEDETETVKMTVKHLYTHFILPPEKSY
jgi:hypothetical protein